MSEYEAVLEKISKIEALVRDHFEFSEGQSNALLKKKETAKTIARDHQVSLVLSSLFEFGLHLIIKMTYML